MKINTILFLLLFACINTYAQQNKWVVGVSQRMGSSTGSFNTYGTNILKFWEIDYSSGTPVVTQRVTGTSVSSTLSIGLNEPIHNGIAPDGSVAFYVFANPRYPYNAGTIATTHGDDIVFIAHDATTGKDEIFATVNLSSGGAASVKNIEVIPYETDPNKYFVVYKTACVNYQSPDEIQYVTVDMVTKTISVPTTIASNELNEGMALTPFTCRIQHRWLYYVKYLSTDNLAIYKRKIDSDVFSAATLAYTISIPGNSSYGQGDIDVSPDGTKLAVCNLTSSTTTKDIIILNIDLATGNLSGEVAINNPGNSVVCLEFSPDSKRIFACKGGSGAIASEMYNILVPSSGTYTIAASDVTLATMESCHSIELAPDGKLYYTDSPYMTQLKYILNPNSPAPNVFGTSVTNIFGVGNGATIGLPDIIDGESLAGGSVSIIGPTSVCAGQAILLSASGTGTFSWSGGSVSSTNDSIIVNPAGTTTYTVTLTEDGCVSSGSLTVVVTPLPNVSVTATDSICEGQSVTLTASGASTYSWSGGVISSSASITDSPLVTTQYYVTGTTAGCSGVVDTFTVFVVNPVLATVFAPASLCEGQTADLISTLPVSWSGGGLSVTGDTVNISPVISTFYYYTYNTLCGVESDSVFVEVFEIPQANIIGPNNICSGIPVQLIATGTGLFSWTGGITSVNDTVSVTPSSTTSFYLTATNVCGSDSDTLVVTVFTQPDATITGITMLCEGDSVILSVALQAGTITWSGGISSSLNSVTVSPTVETTYFVQVMNGPCSDEDTLTVAVGSYAISVIGSSYNKCTGYYSFSATPAISYEWNFSDGFTSTVQNPLHMFALANTTYTIELVTNAGFPCVDTTEYSLVTQEIVITGEPVLPNIFTPNGDGMNDFFGGLSYLCDYDQIVIYDRWGVLVFESDNVQTMKWNGKFKNTEATQGVYYYIIKGKKVPDLTGHLTLSR